MTNGLQSNSQSQDIGSLILQAGRWDRIEDNVKAGVPIRGIALALLEDDEEIRMYYEQSGSTNPQKTLSNVISYHVNNKVPMAERAGYKMFRHFFERETGDTNVLTNLKQMVEIQQERAAQAILFERKIGVVTGQAGREMMILTNILSNLGKLMISAGLDIREQVQREPAKAQEESSRGNRVLYTFLELLKRHGYSDARAIELLTGVPDLTGATKGEPDPLGMEKINLFDVMRCADEMKDALPQSES